jgi:hypothetical protein
METTVVDLGRCQRGLRPIGKDNLDAVATWVSCPRPKAAIGGLPYLPLYPKPIFRWHFRPCSSRIQA